MLHLWDSVAHLCCGSVPQTQTGWTELSSAQNFTQDDVDLNRLWYQHAAPAAHGFKGHDGFSFSLSDLDNETPAQSFFISINRPPKGQRSHLRPPEAGTVFSWLLHLVSHR